MIVLLHKMVAHSKNTVFPAEIIRNLQYNNKPKVVTAQGS